MKPRNVMMKLPIINFDVYCGEGMQPQKRKHSELLPNHVRCIRSGPSNSGKTNVMLNLLFSPNGLHFENVYVFLKSLYQSKYKFLEHVLTSLPDIGYYAFSENEQVPHPNDVKHNSVMIFDDVSCEKQGNVKNYFTMGRHNSIDTFLLCQTYSQVPKQLVRDNCNVLVLFKQDDTNLKHVYNDHVNTDMTYNQFKDLCAQVWKYNNKFVVIEKNSEINNGRYRKGFDSFL